MTTWSDRPRRRIRIRFFEPIDPRLHDELQRLRDSRGARSTRFADTLAPIEVVVRERYRGEQWILGYLEPPQHRYQPLDETDFELREAQPATWPEAVIAGWGSPATEDPTRR